MIKDFENVMVINHVGWYRKRKGLSQSKLAELVGVSKNTISNIERGIYIPGVDIAIKISWCLGAIPIHRLFQFEYPHD